jgi:hypothetical protein
MKQNKKYTHGLMEFNGTWLESSKGEPRSKTIFYQNKNIDTQCQNMPFVCFVLL